MATIRIFQNEGNLNLLKHLPGYQRSSTTNTGDWNEHTFICEEDGPCDYAIVFNRVGKKNRYIHCAKENVWQVTQEPFVFHSHDWMIDDQGQYSRVYTHYLPNDATKYVRSYPMLTWHVDKTYDELSSMDVPKKTNDISWITSTKSSYPGHKHRLEFLDFIRASNLELSLFGSGIQYIEDKWDALVGHRYSLAVENESQDDYWTEKLADCFLAYTLPIYYGCTNIDNYFPTESYILIDINKPEEALDIIQQAIANNEWEKRLPAIIEARNLVLNTYNPAANIAKEIERSKNSPSSSSIDIELRPYKRTLRRRLANKCQQLRTLLRG